MTPNRVDNHLVININYGKARKVQTDSIVLAVGFCCEHNTNKIDCNGI